MSVPLSAIDLNEIMSGRAWRSMPEAAKKKFLSRLEQEVKARNTTLTPVVAFVDNPADVWQPDPKNIPQQRALASEADIIGYGGQAGGGKTDTALGIAIREHSRAIIFRRFGKDLKDIIRRAKEITESYRTGFNGSDFTLTMPGGRTLEFGGMKETADWERQKGRPHDYYGFEEVTEFEKEQVTSTIAWLRSTRPGQRRRVLMTFNPPTDANGVWVIEYFAPWLDEKHENPAQEGELRWFAMVNGEEVARPNGDEFEHVNGDGVVEMLKPLSRTFFRARLSDNRFLDADGEYRRQLQNTPEPLRSQLLYGKFSLSIPVNPWQVIPTAWVQAAIKRGKEREQPTGPPDVLGVDIAHGGKDKTAIAKRWSDYIGPIIKYPGEVTPTGNAAARLVINEYQPGAYINVDAIGYGASAHERLADKEGDDGYGLPAYAVIASSAASVDELGLPYTDKSGKLKMRNSRSEMYWRLREELDPDNNSTLCLPDDREMIADLCTPTYKITPSGLQIESKDDIKKRLPNRRSTDIGDAVALTMLPPPAPPVSKYGAVDPLGGFAGGSTKTDIDNFL